MSIDKHSVEIDNSHLSRIDRAFFYCETACHWLGGFAIILMVALAAINVLGRWLFNLPVSGYIDWAEQLMAFIALLGIAYTMRLGGHIRMEILINKFSKRYAYWAEIFVTLITLLIVLFLVYGAYLHFLRAYQIGDSSVDINLPIWPAKLIVPFALSILAMRLLLQLWAYLRLLWRNDDKRIALPAMTKITDIGNDK